MRIQLLHPPVHFNVRSLTALRPSPPLGLAYIAAALRSAGHSVDVIDAVAEGVDQVEADGLLHCMGLTDEQVLARIHPDTEVLGIGLTWSFSWPRVRGLIRRIHQRFPALVLVGGGEHFSGLAEFSLRQSPLDFVVVGEGEDTAVELMAALAAGRTPTDVPGLVLRHHGEIVHTPRRERRRDLDALPRPAWDLFHLDVYNQHALLPGLRRGYTVPILATRGCPYQCTYCSSATMWTTRWTARDPVQVVDEIEHAVAHLGARNFPFQDLTAILRRDWIVAFCEELLRRDLRITWQLPSGTRCEVIDDEVAELLRRTGGRHLAFAPESGSDAVRQRIKKQMGRAELLAAVRAAVKQRLSLTCFLVLGFPEDTAADLKASLRLARRLAFMGVTDVAVGYFFPIPNTALYHELLAAGRIHLDDDFLRTPMFANDPFLKERNNYARGLSAARLSFTKHWIVANFYALSFLCRPWRLLQVLVHVARGQETAKLETFLIELRRKVQIWWGRRQGRAPRAPAPRPAESPQQEPAVR